MPPKRVRDDALDAALEAVRKKPKKTKETKEEAKDEMHLFAILSKAAYAKKDSSRQKVLSVFNETKDKWEYDEKKSTRDFAVFSSKACDSGGENPCDVISYRGTDLGSANWLRDLYADAQIAAGTFKDSERYKGVKKETERIVASLGDRRVAFTGHSLGGRLASDIGRDLKIPSVVFNKGSGVSGVTDKLEDKDGNWLNKLEYDTVHYTTNDASGENIDILSGMSVWFGDGDKNVSVQPVKTDVGVHGIDNFLPTPIEKVEFDQLDGTNAHVERLKGAMHMSAEHLAEPIKDLFVAYVNKHYTQPGFDMESVKYAFGNVNNKFLEGKLQSNADIPSEISDPVLFDLSLSEMRSKYELFETKAAYEGGMGTQADPEFGGPTPIDELTLMNEEALAAAQSALTAEEGVKGVMMLRQLREDLGAALTPNSIMAEYGPGIAKGLGAMSAAAFLAMTGYNAWEVDKIRQLRSDITHRLDTGDYKNEEEATMLRLLRNDATRAYKEGIASVTAQTGVNIGVSVATGAAATAIVESGTLAAVVGGGAAAGVAATAISTGGAAVLFGGAYLIAEYWDPYKQEQLDKKDVADYTSDTPTVVVSDSDEKEIAEFRDDIIPHMMKNPLTHGVAEQLQQMNMEKLTQYLHHSSQSSRWIKLIPLYDYMAANPKEFDFDSTEEMVEAMNVYSQTRGTGKEAMDSHQIKFGELLGFTDTMVHNYNRRNQDHVAMARKRKEEATKTKELADHRDMEEYIAYRNTDHDFSHMTSVVTFDEWKRKRDHEKLEKNKATFERVNRGKEIDPDMLASMTPEMRAKVEKVYGHHNMAVGWDMHVKDYADLNDKPDDMEHARIAVMPPVDRDIDMGNPSRDNVVHIGSAEIEGNHRQPNPNNPRGTLHPTNDTINQPNWDDTNANGHTIADKHLDDTGIDGLDPHASKTSDWYTNKMNPDTGDPQKNPHPHHGHDTAKQMENDKALHGVVSTYLPDDQYAGGVHHEHTNNSSGVSHGPVNQALPGESHNIGGGTGSSRSTVSMGDLRSWAGLNGSVLNQEPLAQAAQRNFMHVLSEISAYD